MVSITVKNRACFSGITNRREAHGQADNTGTYTTAPGPAPGEQTKESFIKSSRLGLGIGRGL